MSENFRYSKLGYVALNVTDLPRSVAFYRDVVGLDSTGVDENGPAFFRCSESSHDIVLYQGETAGVRRIAFEMESEADLQAAERRLQELGVAVQQVDAKECELLGQGRTIRSMIPTCRVPIELYIGGRTVGPFEPKLTEILRLGHVVIGITNFDDTVKWLTEKFGFRASDYLQGKFAFLRCFPNPYHHSLGLESNTRNTLNHIAFMVKSIDDIGRANNRLRRAGAKIVFGPGRHVASGSIFLYFLDPDGMTLEYTLGMEEFDEHAPRDARQLEPKLDVVDEWGGIPDPAMGKGGIIETPNFV